MSLAGVDGRASQVSNISYYRALVVIGNVDTRLRITKAHLRKDRIRGHFTLASNFEIS